ncbi:MAG: hypothetical protein JNL08_16325 [Planctomycetes bacterium]|nr:hypothetical protein [Planctomycetota bacterium]
MRSLGLLPLLILLCGGCGGSSSNPAGTTGTTGSVLVVVDSATGSDALATWQVDAAVLATADGATTANLLANPHQVRFADPTGTPDGLVLRDAPTGDYAALHLLLVPQSGAVVQADGTILPLAGTIDLVVPIADGLQHSDLADSWLVVGHNGAPPTASPWLPQMSARADTAPVAMDGLDVAVVQGRELVARSHLHAGAPLRVQFAAGCEFTDDRGGAVGDAAGFVDAIGQDQVQLLGDLRRDGTLVARRAHRSGRNDNPRLIGRITALEPATSSFVMAVQAQNPRGGPVLDPLPDTIRVDASAARLHRPAGQPLAFGDLQLQHLVKLKWRSRSEPAGELPRFVASEVEVASGPAAMQPEWQGRVDGIDAGLGTITVVPRNDDPIVIAGVVVPQATISVLADTVLERRARHGGGRTTIRLDQIVPGQDRIWWRGTVTGPTTVDATWVRVREE